MPDRPDPTRPDGSISAEPTSGRTPLTGRERWVAGTSAAILTFTATWRLGVSEWLPDELVYARAGAAYVSGDFSANPEHPPLAKFLFGLGQRLTGSEVVGTRLVSALASIAIGVLLFALVRRMISNRAGLIALVLWALLPHAGSMTGAVGEVGRLDRFGMLDPVATALALGAVVAGWSWLQRPTWQTALATGLLGGLAAGAKPGGVLVLPAIAGMVLWTRRGEGVRPYAGVAIAVLGSVAGLALAYAPMGTQAPEAFAELVRFQSQHAAEGHTVTVAGTTTDFPPWWSHLWFHIRDDGWVLTAVLFGGLLAAPWLVRGRPDDQRRAVTYLAAVFAVPFVALAASPVKLPFYRYVWLPYLVAFLAISFDALEDRIERARRGLDVPRLVAAVVVIPLAGLALATVVGIATVAPSGYPVVAEQLREAGVAEGDRVLLRGRARLLEAYLPGLVLVDDLPADAVVLESGIVDRFPDPAIDVIVDDPNWRCEGDGLVLCLPR